VTFSLNIYQVANSLNKIEREPLTEWKIAVKSCGMYARNLLTPHLLTPQRDRSCGRFYGFFEIHQKVAALKQPSFLSIPSYMITFQKYLDSLLFLESNHSFLLYFSRQLGKLGKSANLKREETLC